MSYQSYAGSDGLWGVEEVTEYGQSAGVLYEPQFAKITAEAIADMENSENPPKDWEETADRLDVAGLPH